ncbi:MAG: hypothetical protein ACP5I4_15605 [Oceanipulchritudo sp.]
MAKDIVSEVHAHAHIGDDAVGIAGRDGTLFGERILLQPCAEVGLDLDDPALVDLGDFRLDADDALLEIDVGRPELADFPVLPVRAGLRVSSRYSKL